LQLDLCSLRTVHDATAELKQRYKRLDVVICNAGIGGWTGIDWFGLVKQFLTEGLMSMTTSPGYKLGTLGAATKTQIIQKLAEGDPAGGSEEPKLGEVFTANVFGHYVLVHGIASLLRRTAVPGQETERARVVWVSTLQAVGSNFDMDDLQGMKTTTSYESSKRLTDVLALSSRKGDTKEFVEAFLDDPQPASEASPKKSGRTTRSSTKNSPALSSIGPDMYVSHPGVCVTTIMPLHSSLVWLQKLVFYFVRLLGSPWHNVSTEKGASAMVWLALEDQAVLEETEAVDVKWGSAVSRWGRESVMESPVDSFEAIEKEVWEQMEELRVEWEARFKDS
jgi:3-keto steroid reductase